MKLSPMEERLLGLLSEDTFQSAKSLMKQLYRGKKKPTTDRIGPMVYRMRKKGVKIDSVRGQGYRLTRLTVDLAVYDASRLTPSLSQGGSLRSEFSGALARYGVDRSLLKKIVESVRGVVRHYRQPDYARGAIEYVRRHDGVYDVRPE